MPRFSILIFIPAFFAFQKATATFFDTIPSNKVSTLYLKDGSVKKGYVLDSNSKGYSFYTKDGPRYSVQTVPSEDVARIKTKKKEFTTGDSMLAGAIVGIILGFSAGLNSCPSGNCDFAERLFSTKSFKAAWILGAGLGFVGLVLGLVLREKRSTNKIKNLGY